MGGQRRRSGRTEKEKWEDREGRRKEKDAKWNKVEELGQKG